MSVLSFAADDLFVIKTVKYLGSSPLNKWANTYEVQAMAAGDETTLNVLVSALVLFEAGFHHDVVRFDHVVVSTWEDDHVPYDPSSFISIPQSGTGNVGPVTDLVALNQALSVARVPTSGRFGHIFYRGVLEEAEVAAPAGRTVLTDPAAQQTKIDTALGFSELDGYFSSGAEPPLRFVMVSKDGSQIRLINSLVVQGVSTIPQDHAWYNRSSPTP